MAPKDEPETRPVHDSAKQKGFPNGIYDVAGTWVGSRWSYHDPHFAIAQHPRWCWRWVAPFVPECFSTSICGRRGVATDYKAALWQVELNGFRETG